LISLRKAATEMERVESLRAVLVESYGNTIRAASEYAIELNAREASDFQKNLEALAGQVRSAGESTSIRRVQADFRDSLRSYRDQAHTRIAHLRDEVEASAAAVAAFASAIASNGSDHQAQMNTELDRLRGMTRSDDLCEIHRGLASVIAGISEAAAQMQCANQMTIAQLRDEIRILHYSMDATHREAATDVATGAWSRQKCAERVQILLRGNEAFRVLLISVTNIKRMEGRYSAAAVEGALKELTRRLRDVTGAESPIGRWSESEFLVILDVDKTRAMALSREASMRLSGAYAHPDGVVGKPIHLEVATGLVERPAATDGEAFLKKLDQLSAALVNN
jgi:GGDEF domain-containing protein